MTTTTISSWLLQFTDLLPSDFEILEDRIILNCKNAYLARECWEKREELTDTGKGLVVLLNGQFIDSTFRLQNMLESSWLKHNRPVFEAQRNLCTAAIHGESEGFPYLAIQPYLGIEAILNKPIHDLLGQSINSIETVIAEARQSAIQRAIAIGGVATEIYSHRWMGVDWQKKVTAIYLPGHQEVQVLTTPALGEEWQNGFWQNWKGLAS